MRVAIRTALTIAAIAAAPLTGGNARAQTKVAVAPFAPLSGDVPVKAGPKGADLLLGELKNLGTITPIEIGVEKNEAAEASLKAAYEAINAAQALEARRKFGAAAAAYRKAIANFDAAVPAMADVTDLSDAHVALGIVLYLTGQDTDGARELAQAVALTPERKLPRQDTSPLFAATVKSIREQVMSAQRGTLRVESMPPGALVTLDGAPVKLPNKDSEGRTPIVIKDIPPGKHVWRVLISSSQPIGGAVVIANGQAQKVTASLGGLNAVSRLNNILSNNKLDDAALAAARQVATAAEADLLVFGGLFAKGQDMVLESFLYSPSSNVVVRLPQKQFDAEMLSAGMELFAVATDIGGRTENLGNPEKTPAKVCIEVPPPAAAELTEVAYTVPGEQKEQVEGGGGTSGPRIPITGTTKRPLRDREK